MFKYIIILIFGILIFSVYAFKGNINFIRWYNRINYQNWFKLTIGIISIFVLLFILDIVCIFTINRPLFAIQNDGGYVYKGIFYDTYNCSEYSVPQIKVKGSKFSCSLIKANIDKVFSIIDTSNDIKDFACDDALENFYEDNNYTYYFPCSKSKYIVVKYENGYEEKVSDALKYGKITTQDLNTYNINYYMYKK